MTIFFDKSGPLMRYANGVLRIEDLNPELSAAWRLTRWERLVIGVRFILAAMMR